MNKLFFLIISVQQPFSKTEGQESKYEEHPAEMSMFESKLPQQDVEEKQLIENIENAPGIQGRNEGRSIEGTISSTDQNEHMVQADDLRHIQEEEMQGDMARLKEATQNGLQDMFSAAVKKQQTFIKNVQNGALPNNEDAEVKDQINPAQVKDTEQDTALMAIPDPREASDDEQPIGGPLPGSMAGDATSLFGPPDRWSENNQGENEPFDLVKDFLPETNNDPSGYEQQQASRKDEIMGIVPDLSLIHI